MKCALYSDSDIIYIDAYHGIGNVGALDVTASTWFGTNLEYVHGINM